MLEMWIKDVKEVGDTKVVFTPDSVLLIKSDLRLEAHL
jgi:hypothetical protein